MGKDKEKEVESLLPDYSERSRSGTPRPEPVIDPERVALENTVRVSDSALATLEKERLRTKFLYNKVETEYEEAKLSQMKESLYFKVEGERLEKKNDVTDARAKALIEDMKDASASIEYATLIVEPPSDPNDKEKTKTYVLKLQKQVIEAVENMQAAPKKLANLVDNFDEAVNRLRAQLLDLMDSRSRTEVELRKQIHSLAEEIEEIDERYHEQIKDSEEKLVMLKAKWNTKQTFEDLEEELEEADGRLEELKEVREEQALAIKKLEASSKNGGS